MKRAARWEMLSLLVALAVPGNFWSDRASASFRRHYRYYEKVFNAGFRWLVQSASATARPAAGPEVTGR